jgi:hypothetical protein
VSRIFLSGLLAIALLFLGSVAIVYRFGGGSPGASAASSPRSAPVPGSDRPASLAPVRGASGAAAPRAAERPAPAEAPRRTPKPEVMPPSRRHALVSFRREMMAGLAELEARVGRCAPGSAAASDTGSRRAASYTLGLETVGGGIRIADVRLEARGSASDADVACATAALRDRVIPAPSAEPGRSWQLRFSPGGSP